VLTANHYWFDAATAAAVLGIAVATDNALGRVVTSVRTRSAPAVVQIQQGALS
jgi:hypothetical protein